MGGGEESRVHIDIKIKSIKRDQELQSSLFVQLDGHLTFLNVFLDLGQGGLVQHAQIVLVRVGELGRHLFVDIVLNRDRLVVVFD